MSKWLKRGGYLFWGLVALLLLYYILRSVISDSLVTEMVKTGTMENAVTVQGLLIKNETVYTADAAGAFEPQAGEGAKVSKGSRIGSVYKGEIDPGLKKQLNQVNKRIDTLKSSAVQSQTFSNDLGKVDSEINSEINSLISSAGRGEMKKVSQYKMAVSMLATHRAVINGEDVAVETQADLEAQKRSLETQMGASRSDIYARNSGVFSTYLDGLEGEITPARIPELKPNDLKKYKDISIKTVSQAESGKPVCKVVDNFEYYTAVALDAKLASDLREGQSIKLRFSKLSTDPVDCTIRSISEEQGGQVVLAAAANTHVADLFSKRQVAVDVIKSQHKGLKIPVSAIRTQGDVKGVYVIRESVMKFVPVDISYNDSEYAIVRENAEDKNALKLYDELILRADSYEDGKLVR